MGSSLVKKHEEFQDSENRALNQAQDCPKHRTLRREGLRAQAHRAGPTQGTDPLCPQGGPAAAADPGPLPK